MRLVEKLEDVESLPTLMTQECLDQAIGESLDLASIAPHEAAIAGARAFVELLSRQTEMYRGFPDIVAASIEDWLVSAWRPDSPEFLEAAGELIVNHRMPRAMALLEEIALSGLNEASRAMAAEWVAEARGE